MISKRQWGLIILAGAFVVFITGDTFYEFIKYLAHVLFQVPPE